MLASEAVGDQFSAYEQQRMQAERNLNGAMQSGWGNSPAHSIQSPARGASGYDAPEIQRPHDVWANTLPSLANGDSARSRTDRDANGSVNSGRGNNGASDSRPEVKSRRNDWSQNASNRSGIVEPEPYQSRGNDVADETSSYGSATQVSHRNDDAGSGSRGSDGGESRLPRINPRRDR